MINEQKNKVIDNLANESIYTTSSEYVEHITLVSDSDDYYHGFKIYYNDEWVAQYATYFRTSLIPNKEKCYTSASVVSPDQFKALLSWRMDKEIIVVETTPERTIKFPKKPPAVMTEL